MVNIGDLNNYYKKDRFFSKARLFLMLKLYLLSLCVVKGSGSNVDLCIITADKTENIRPFDQIATKAPR